jgi:hypothetical protein
MPKFNQKGAQSARKTGPVSPMTTTGTTKTFEGGAGFTRDAKSELYLTSVTNMVGEDTFYESAREKDDRFVKLVRQVVLEDPDWAFRFLGWLRNKANMRSASVVFAAEAVKARLDAKDSSAFDASVGGQPGYAVKLGTKDFVWQGMARADEPGEFLAYWTSKYGKNLPQPVKRGLALATNNLFNEYSYAKYGKSGAWQLSDIVNLVHPTPKDSVQGDLYRHALNERNPRNKGKEIPESLTMLRQRKQITSALTRDGVRALMASDEGRERLKAAGMTWEALTGMYGELDAAFWESLIFSGQLGYMAMLRNLRNFEKAQISREARAQVCTRLAAPGEVARSRQFPFRFLSAYKAVESDWWSLALSDALDHSVGNLPVFPGRTLVLVDTSASMDDPISQKSSVTHAEIGALFGVVLARAGESVDLHGFAGGSSYYSSYSFGNTYGRDKVSFKHDLPKGGSMLKGIQSFTKRIGEVGHGTQMVQALKETYDGHDRVILVTDMQAFAAYGGDEVTSAVPADVRMYGINPSGYASTALDLSKRNRYEVGGFSDQVFRMIRLLEAGDTNWPF